MKEEPLSSNKRRGLLTATDLSEQHGRLPSFVSLGSTHFCCCCLGFLLSVFGYICQEPLRSTWNACFQSFLSAILCEGSRFNTSYFMFAAFHGGDVSNPFCWWKLILAFWKSMNLVAHTWLAGFQV